MPQSERQSLHNRETTRGQMMMDSPVDTTDEEAEKSFTEVGPHVGMKTNS